MTPLRQALAFLAAWMVCHSAPAQLLTPTLETQLGTWLGQGGLSFTTIFTKTVGDGNTSLDFHAAVDGRGATFTLLEISAVSYALGTLPPQVIGGYNPLPWNSSGTFNLSTTDAERTAFIYNLTSGEVQYQQLIANGHDVTGGFQTWNHPDFGPTFGALFDLAVQTSLEEGFAVNVSYGSAPYTDTVVFGDTGPYRDLPYWDVFSITRLEVYTFRPVAFTPVPEPSTYGLLGGLVLGGIIFWRHRRRASGDGDIAAP